MRNISQHAEWLSLIEVSGPFLTVSMLEKAFPQGLETVATPRRQRFRAAYEEWRDAVDESDPMLEELHREWISLVLMEILEYDQAVMVENNELGEFYTYRSSEHAVEFSPDLVIKNESDERPRLLVSIQPPKTELDKTQTGDNWPASIKDRMILLCTEASVRVGLITNGDQWMMVNAPIGSTSSHASWYARHWFQEPVTLKAFQSLLGVRRCFGPADETLVALLEESLKNQEEVTDTLGEQVRRAVEVLVQCLDKANEDRNRELLRNVSTAELYEAGLTVMMRLVFVLCAEERELLLLGDPVYDQCYAVSTLRGQLTEDANLHGPEVLDRRYDAWSRLLAVFRAVFSGVEHESLRMPALGGSLFDPDRFPFLEGRIKGTRWRDGATVPLPIDNRTVLMLLEALQVLEQHGGALLLSYRALDVEQIGHVYEGLLEYTVARVPQITVGVIGSFKANNPNLPLVELESALMDGEQSLLKLLAVTQRSQSAIRNALSRPVDEDVSVLILSICGGDTALAKRILPYANLLRTDAWGEPIVYHENALIVTLGTDRRETGTHYTPKSLTESVVGNTLEPVVYQGSADGKPRDQWLLKSTAELLELKVCDPTMGSGAFLVQACRWLAERLLESWGIAEAYGKIITVNGEVREQSDDCELMPLQLDERLIIARRLVAERCLYGVDINPMAVELAKLSIWLVTLAKGRPFGFLDHNLRKGDSLLGIHRLDQITMVSLYPEKRNQQLQFFAQNIKDPIKEAIAMRRSLRETPIRDIHDVEAAARLNLEARKKLSALLLVSDAIIGEALLVGGDPKALESALDRLSPIIGEFINGNDDSGKVIASRVIRTLSTDLPPGKLIRKPFHWVLEFPEVFLRENSGFDAIVGNPPFLGGQKITGILGTSYRELLVKYLGNGVRGSADLVAYFFLRAHSLINIQGFYAFIATKTISEGDTRQVGLDQITETGGFINRVTSKYRWPGTAAVLVNVICISKVQPNNCFIDNNKVGRIDSALSPGTSRIRERKNLAINDGRCCIGSYLQGTGFYLPAVEAKALLNQDKRLHDVMRPLLRGEDILNTFDEEFTMYGINFGSMTESEAKAYRPAYDIVVKCVKPERLFSKDQKLAKYWWRYKRITQYLYDEAQKIERVLVHGFVSKYVVFRFVPSKSIFVAPLVVILSDKWTDFAILQSTFHQCWVENVSSKGTTLRYTPTDCFNTFPFPNLKEGIPIEEIGESYYHFRCLLSETHRDGLTKIYNRFHDSDNNDEDVKKLRALQVEMDEIVAMLYGWTDLNLQYDFHETSQGVRYTICENTRVELLDRLTDLNRQQFNDEVDHGSNENKPQW